MSAAEIVDWINGIIWSKALIYLCLGAGLFFYFDKICASTSNEGNGQTINKRYFFRTGDFIISSLSCFIIGTSRCGNIAGVAAAMALVGRVLSLDVVGCIFRSKHGICRINFRSNL